MIITLSIPVIPTIAIECVRMVLNGQTPHALTRAERNERLAAESKQRRHVESIANQLDDLRASLTLAVSPSPNDPRGILVRLFQYGISHEIMGRVESLIRGVGMYPTYVDCAEFGE